MAMITENKFAPNTYTGVTIETEMKRLEEEFRNMQVEARESTTKEMVKRKNLGRNIASGIALGIFGMFAAGALSLFGIVPMTAPVLGIALGAGLIGGTTFNTVFMKKFNTKRSTRESQASIEKNGVMRYMRNKTLKYDMEKNQNDLARLDAAIIRDARNQKIDKDIEQFVEAAKERDNYQNRNMLPPSQRGRM